MSDESQIEAVTAPAEETTAVSNVANNGEPAGDEHPEQQEPRTFTQEEVDRIATRERAAERRRYERELREAQQAPRQTTLTPPDPSKFKTQEEYVDALITHRANEVVAQKEEDTRRKTVDSTYIEREEAARDKHADFDTKIKADGWYLSPIAYEAIKESEVGPDVAYYLASNPKESKRIFDLSPVSQIREIGKIEAKLASEPPVVKASSAPSPITPIGSRTSSSSYSTSDPRSITKTSASEWIEQRNQEIAKKARN